MTMETTDYTDDESDSSLAKQKWWADQYLDQINGFWLIPEFVPGIRRVLNHYKPSPTDVILASFPKTGTTWLKSLLYSIINRSSKEALVMNHPHELVPTLEIQVYSSQESSFPSPASHDLHTTTRIFSTHIPHQLMAKTLNSSDCRVVYVTRNPKDTLVSMWHFVNKWKMAEQEPRPIEVAIEKFCSGIFPCGPYYDHVLGYKKESLERPNKVFFITYEELKDDPKTHVKKLAEFLGCPFEGDDDKELELDEVVKSCSFDVLSNYQVNKSENFPTWFEVPYNSFFRQGAVGDHRNYLSVETIERIDALTREKFHGSGFTYGI